ncbi:hypothetical protein DFH06DRAFT_1163853 [Mycena polygramma]|nr:hypothetical protein DFH06DRAFT_1163853 [Mycena polygramma]
MAATPTIVGNFPTDHPGPTAIASSFFTSDTTRPFFATLSDLPPQGVPRTSLLRRFLIRNFTVTTVNLTGSAVASSSSTPDAQPFTNTQSDGISTAALAGLSLGLGLLVGIICATIIYIYRRRRAAKNARGRPADGGEALLAYQDEEKQGRLETPVPERTPVPHARVLEWVQRNRTTSISSIASSYFPTIVSDSQSTVMRSQSMASSRSAYSQASALPSRASEENHHESEGGPSRPPELYRINE